MTTVAINQKQNRTQYTGLDEGAVPVTVYRKALFTVAHIGEAVEGGFGSSKFHVVKFVDQASGKLFENSLYEGHMDRLADTLVEGATVELEYAIGSGWIKSINGKRWN